MHRFFINQLIKKDLPVFLEGDEHRHLMQVLRLRPKDQIQITDPDGKSYCAEILNISKERTELFVLDEIDRQTENRMAKLSLFQGMPKSQKLDLIIQKGTELGAEAFYPFYSARSVVKPGSKDHGKCQRMQRVAHEAAKQSGRQIVPDVHAYLSFNDALDELRTFDLVLVAYENEENRRLKEELKALEKKDGIRIALVIGPEGGFDELEIDRLKAIGARIISLGKRILRTETAGLAMLSQINYEFDEG